MNRRRFLQLTAASTMARLFSRSQAFCAESQPEKTRPFSNRQLLHARNNNRSTVVARHGMVCTSQPLATMAGIDLLKAGGNCVDAALAANAMLGLTEPQSNGLGGDLFAIVWIEKEQKLVGLNASGRSPYDWSLADAQAMSLTSIPGEGVLSWSVPGCVNGWEMLNRQFGAKRLAECLEPTIQAALEGFPLSPIIAEDFDWPNPRWPHLAQVYHPDGKIPRYGEIFRNPLLAQSLQAIAQDGAGAFYEGKIAERIVAKSKELGGRMSLKDLKDHTAQWVEPVSSSYRGWNVWEIPPNGQGIAVLQILNILEQFDLGSLQPNSAEHLHLFIEAKKLAYEDRAVYYADPEFADVPVAWLISKEYAKKRAALIDPHRARTELRCGDPQLDSDTIYLTAADSQGNMISLIQSNFAGFGSKVCPDDVGFVMQNRGRSFSLDPKHRNRLEPHKRPFHTIIPAFLTRDGRPVMSFGVMGGDFQPQGHAQAVMNMIDFGLSPQQAGDQPRVAHDGNSTPSGGSAQGGGRVTLEHGFPESVRQQLVAMGHQISPQIGAHGGYQAIWREDSPLRYFGGSDPRKDGCAIGY